MENSSYNASSWSPACCSAAKARHSPTSITSPTCARIS